MCSFFLSISCGRCPEVPERDGRHADDAHDGDQTRVRRVRGQQVQPLGQLEASGRGGQVRDHDEEGGHPGDGHEAEDHRHPPVHLGREAGLQDHVPSLHLQAGV